MDTEDKTVLYGSRNDVKIVSKYIRFLCEDNKLSKERIVILVNAWDRILSATIAEKTLQATKNFYANESRKYQRKDND